MDFHSLTRKELQALCKRNRIKANMTNVAMADALYSLEIVEGLDEITVPQHKPQKELVQNPALAAATRRQGARNSRRAVEDGKMEIDGNPVIEIPDTPAALTGRKGPRTRRAPEAANEEKQEGGSGHVVEPITPVASVMVRKATSVRARSRTVRAIVEEEQKGLLVETPATAVTGRKKPPMTTTAGRQRTRAKQVREEEKEESEPLELPEILAAIEPQPEEKEEEVTGLKSYSRKRRSSTPAMLAAETSIEEEDEEESKKTEKDGIEPSDHLSYEDLSSEITDEIKEVGTKYSDGAINQDVEVRKSPELVVNEALEDKGGAVEIERCGGEALCCDEGSPIRGLILSNAVVEEPEMLGAGLESEVAAPVKTPAKILPVSGGATTESLQVDCAKEIAAGSDICDPDSDPSSTFQFLSKAEESGSSTPATPALVSKDENLMEEIVEVGVGLAEDGSYLPEQLFNGVVPVVIATEDSGTETPTRANASAGIDTGEGISAPEVVEESLSTDEKENGNDEIAEGGGGGESTKGMEQKQDVVEYKNMSLRQLKALYRKVASKANSTTTATTITTTSSSEKAAAATNDSSANKDMSLRKLKGMCKKMVSKAITITTSSSEEDAEPAATVATAIDNSKNKNSDYGFCRIMVSAAKNGNSRDEPMKEWMSPRQFNACNFSGNSVSKNAMTNKVEGNKNRRRSVLATLNV